jgi:hypothetical protein
MVVEMWEWAVMRDTRRNPVGVCRTRERAMAALADALVESGRPGRGTVARILLINEAWSDAHYDRFPVTAIAVYDQSTIRWEKPSWRGAQRSGSGVIERGRQALCGV